MNKLIIGMLALMLMVTGVYASDYGKVKTPTGLKFQDIAIATYTGSIEYSHNTNTVTISKDCTANVVDERVCRHEWVYSNIVLLSNPPIYQKICKLCGLEELQFGVYSGAKEEYSQIKAKFLEETQRTTGQ